MTKIVTNQSLAENFLTEYFGKMQQGYLLLWTKQDKCSYSFTLPNEIKAAAALACTLTTQNRDVYFGVTPSNTFYKGIAGRGKAENATALVALWADVDLACGVHSAQSKNPADAATVKTLLKGMPNPSIAVHSGGGLHLYWLLQEPIEITDTESRKKATSLIEGWQQSIRTVFSAQGYSLDSTADLARLLRVPGTFNYKNPSDPKPVSIINDFNTQEEEI